MGSSVSGTDDSMAGSTVARWRKKCAVSEIKPQRSFVGVVNCSLKYYMATQKSKE